MRRSMLLLAFALACESDQSWFEKSGYLFESMEGREVVAGRQMRLSFDGRDLGAFGGCQGFSAKYWRENGMVVVGKENPESDISVSCGGPLDEQSAWLKAFLLETPSYLIDGPRLILTGDEVTLVMLDEEIADPDRPLVDTVWEIDGLVSNGVVMGTGGSTLVFGANGRLAIDGPCAAGAADFVADEHFVTLANVEIDPPECPGDELGLKMDEHLREFLVDGPAFYEIDATRLVLGDSDFGLMLRSE